MFKKSLLTLVCAVALSGCYTKKVEKTVEVPRDREVVVHEHHSDPTVIERRRTTVIERE